MNALRGLRRSDSARERMTSHCQRVCLPRTTERAEESLRMERCVSVAAAAAEELLNRPRSPRPEFPGSLHTNEVRTRAFRTAAPFRAVFYPQSVAWTVTSTMGTRSDCGIDAVRKRRFLRSTCVWMDMRRKQRASVGVCWHFSLSSRAGTDQCSHYLGCTVGAAACLLCCCVWSIEEVYGHATGQVGNV